MKDPDYVARDRIVWLVEDEAVRRRLRDRDTMERLRKIACKLRETPPYNRRMEAAGAPWFHAEGTEARERIAEAQRAALEDFGATWATDDVGEFLRRMVVA